MKITSRHCLKMEVETEFWDKSKGNPHPRWESFRQEYFYLEQTRMAKGKGCSQCLKAKYKRKILKKIEEFENI